MKRFIVTLLILAAIASVSLDTQTGKLDTSAFGKVSGLFSLAHASPNIGPETIKIATWNIQNFGKTKASKQGVMEIIAQNLRDYDIIAIQEISNLHEMQDPGCPRNENSCPDNITDGAKHHANCNLIGGALDYYLNSAYSVNYEFIFSPHIKDERYLFVYNPDKVEFLFAEIMDDPNDSQPICDAAQENTGRMLRQPFKGNFRAGEFEFTLLTAHTSPSKNAEELEGLELFFRDAESEGNKNIILLGDFNADCSYLRPSDNIALRGSRYIWAVEDSADTTVSNTDCAYDRFIFTKEVQDYYTGQWGVVTDISLDVSDHYLVWAEFSTSNIKSPPTGNFGQNEAKGLLDTIWGLLKPAFDLIGSLISGIF
jgi:endonuclease/exonuclease/phosphatase family metal-dependent hydrolase